jgi:hypothetical protein
LRSDGNGRWQHEHLAVRTGGSALVDVTGFDFLFSPDWHPPAEEVGGSRESRPARARSGGRGRELALPRATGAKPEGVPGGAEPQPVPVLGAPVLPADPTRRELQEAVQHYVDDNLPRVRRVIADWLANG